MTFIEVLALITALPVAGSVIYAAVQLGRVAGDADQRLRALATGLDKLTQSLQAFADRAEARLAAHGEGLAAHSERLRALEAARQWLDR